jgi:UDP-N-acetyl-D-galactosamine dehydrogenase
MLNQEIKIAVVGLGYVGLPLAIELGKKYRTVGFDISERKIQSYLKGVDPAGELDSDQFKQAKHLCFESNPDSIKDADYLIIAVPTPITEANIPDLSHLEAATKLVSENMKHGVTVVYESTVYPGATEEFCVPILESGSGLKLGEGFFVGYSPERVNPGDKERTITRIVKVVSGSDERTLKNLAEIYSSIISAGVYEAESIKVAEAAKVIENTQRDVNIALVNELAIVCKSLNIDTNAVLKAAGTKWNFLNFHPGLVGGHCIGVDPFYLTYKAQTVGYHPELILAGRRINDGMAAYIAKMVVKELIRTGVRKDGGKILVAGLTFKEDCSDFRNSKSFDLIHELLDFGFEVDGYDPHMDTLSLNEQHSVDIVPIPEDGKYDSVIVAVGHTEFRKLGCDVIRRWGVPGAQIVDVKNIFPELDGAIRL